MLFAICGFNAYKIKIFFSEFLKVSFKIYFLSLVESKTALFKV